MNKKIWLVALATCILISVFAVHLATSKGQLAAEIQPHHSDSSPASTTALSVPEPIVYGFLFRNVTRNKERNVELLAKGVAKKKYFAFKRELDFTAEQSRVVTEIASECEAQVRQQDQNAHFVIAEFRANLPKTKEKQAPAPPPELKAMWEERNAIILRARDRLRAALGDDTFERLDNFAKYRYSTNKAPVTLRPIDRGSK